MHRTFHREIFVFVIYHIALWTLTLCRSIEDGNGNVGNSGGVGGGGRVLLMPEDENLMVFGPPFYQKENSHRQFKQPLSLLAKKEHLQGRRAETTNFLRLGRNDGGNGQDDGDDIRRQMSMKLRDAYYKFKKNNFIRLGRENPKQTNFIRLGRMFPGSSGGGKNGVMRIEEEEEFQGGPPGNLPLDPAFYNYYNPFNQQP